MQELTLPYHPDLHRWLGYKGNVKGLAVWWLGDRLALSDGWVTSNEGHTSSMRLIECTPRFEQVLSAFDYGQSIKCSWAVHKDHDVSCLVFMNDKEKIYLAPQADAVKMLNVYNRHSANKLTDECPSIKSKVKRSQRWGMKDDSITNNIDAVKEATVGRPSVDEFEKLSNWLKKHNVKLSVPRAIK